MSPAEPLGRWFFNSAECGFSIFCFQKQKTEMEIKKTRGIEISRLLEEFMRLFVVLIIFQNKHELKLTYSFQSVKGNKASQHVWTKVC